MNWPRFHYAGTVVRVIDGDTVDIHFDFGMKLHQTHRVRIASINAPEVNKGLPEDRKRGMAARDFLAAMLPVGQAVYIRTHKDARTFDRYVADVLYAYEEGDAIDVATMMVQAGHAVWSEG